MHQAIKMQKCEKDIREIDDAWPYSSTERLPKEPMVFGMVMGSDWSPSDYLFEKKQFLD
jgi:hypothetical protein